MKLNAIFKAIFGAQLESDVDPKTLKLALQFPTESGDSILEMETLEIGAVVSLIDAEGNVSSPEDGQYEITDENGKVNIVTIENGSITAVEPDKAPEAEVSPNETELAKEEAKPEEDEDPLENHPLVKEAKEKLALATAKAKAELAKAEVDALKGKKKEDEKPAEEVPAEGDKPAEEAKPEDKPLTKKLAKKLSTEKPAEVKVEAKVEEEVKVKDKPEVEVKKVNTKLSKVERLRAEIAEEKGEETKVTLSADDELKAVKAELALAKEKMKVILSESKPLKVAATTIIDKAVTSDTKISKTEFIKKHILGREDV
jgi:hypothetical protein